MIATKKTHCSKTKEPAWHARFMGMLPAVVRSAQICFRKIRPELREELIQEVVANSLVAYARLVELRKEDAAFPTALARFALGQVRAGRRVGNRLCSREVLSEYAQREKGFFVERLDHFDDQENCWQEVLVEDGRATPADVAASRIDFAQWLKEMPARIRRIARCLATGESTLAAARRFALSPARISQLRREFRTSWPVFQGELPSAPAGTVG